MSLILFCLSIYSINELNVLFLHYFEYSQHENHIRIGDLRKKNIGIIKLSFACATKVFFNIDLCISQTKVKLEMTKVKENRKYEYIWH